MDQNCSQEKISGAEGKTLHGALSTDDAVAHRVRWQDGHPNPGSVRRCFRRHRDAGLGNRPGRSRDLPGRRLHAPQPARHARRYARRVRR